MSLKIVTWNVNSIRARLETVIIWCRENSPDVLLLQETKVIDDLFPKESFEDLGYNLLLHGQKTYNGVAILSKLSIEDGIKGLPSFEDEGARYIEAVIGGKIRVGSIYVPNGQSPSSPQFTYKLGFFEALKNHLKTLLSYEEITIIGGDFNVTPTDQDVQYPDLWHESILCTSQEREAFQSLKDEGFIDALLHLYPSEPPYTWWDYRAGSFFKNNGLRIDHFLLSPQALSTLKEGNADKKARAQKGSSDHAPVWITLDL